MNLARPINSSLSYSAETKGIIVDVRAFFLDTESTPEESIYVWGYSVKITNNSKQPIQLTDRYWHITDAHGNVQEVRGEGVVGEQPHIDCEETYEYTSGAPLATPSGIMRGHYIVQDSLGRDIIVEIPTFSLDSPYENQTLN